MGILSRLFKAIFAAIKKLVKAVVGLIKKFWPILLIFAAIYFAPAITGFLSSMGAPSFLTSTFSWVATTLTPYATSAVSWLMSGAGSLWTSATQAFAGLTLGQKAALTVGALAMLAPDETKDFLVEVGETVGDSVAIVGGSLLAGASNSNLLLMIGGALLVWWALSSDEKEDT